MPSSKTPAGSPETTAAGNSGNRATSQKVSNLTTEAIRGAKSNSATKTETQVTVNQVQVSDTSVAQPPGTTDLPTNSRPDSMESLDRDRYRYSDDPGNRPSRQLGEPDEDTPASLAITGYDGTEIIEGYSSFFLQSVSEAEQEKYQVVETFTAYYVFFYGKRPPIYRYSGMLLNDPDNNWMNTFRFLYENYFRGTASSDLGAQAVLTYDKRAVSGFLLGLNIQQEASSDKGVPFSFDMLVISHDLVGFSTDFDQFIQTQQERLAELRSRASADIASLNKGQDTLQSIFKNSVLTGRIPTASASKVGEVATPKPESNKATVPQKLTNSLVQKAVENNPATATYGVESTQTSDLLIKQ